MSYVGCNSLFIKKKHPVYTTRASCGLSCREIKINKRVRVISAINRDKIVRYAIVRREEKRDVAGVASFAEQASRETRCGPNCVRSVDRLTPLAAQWTRQARSPRVRSGAPIVGLSESSPPLAVTQSLTILCANPAVKWRRFWYSTE